MCTEHTPILACVLPAFDSLLSTWTRPSNAHLRRMIDAAVEKMTSQYNERHFSKPHIISIVLHPSLRFRWIERNWPANQVSYAKRTILLELAKYDESQPAAQSTRETIHQPCV
ncbi:hypothetical protein JB92DRAFT_3275526 [Gautieria morchelliformis]|nr:hypothetical protein JB92DRAFT_3275526 [Gautieria morchelliformis]